MTGTRDERLEIGRKLGADVVVNSSRDDAVEIVRQLTNGGSDYVLDCAGTEESIDQAVRMVNRGGKICLAAFPHEPVSINLAHAVQNNVYLFGIRGEGRSATHRAMALMAAGRVDARPVVTHIFRLKDLQEGLRYARDRIDGAIKVVITPQDAS